MLRLSVSELTTFRWSFEEDVQQYKAAGFDGIGVWRQKLSDYGDEKGIDLICDSGLQVSSLLWAGGFTGSDVRSHRESIDDGIAAVKLAAGMRADCLIVYTGPRGGHTRGHSNRLVRNALAELVSVAADLDVTLAIEPMHRGCAGNWTFVTSVAQAMDLLDSLPGSGTKLVYDTYHLAQDDFDSEQLASLVDRIALVHLADSGGPPLGEQNRVPLGHGKIPLGEIVACLIDLDYDGFYEIELLGEAIEGSDYAQLIRESKQMVDSLVGVGR